MKELSHFFNQITNTTTTGEHNLNQSTTNPVIIQQQVQAEKVDETFVKATSLMQGFEKKYPVKSKNRTKRNDNNFEQIELLTTREQIQSLTREQIQNFKTCPIEKLTNEKIRIFSPHVDYYLQGKSSYTQIWKELFLFKPEQISWLTPKQISWLTPNQIKVLTPEQTKSLLPEQIQALTLEQIKFLQEENFDFWVFLTPTQIQALTREQIQEIKYINKIEKTKLLFIPFKYLKPEQISWLTREQIQDINQNFWLLTNEQIQALTPQQIKFLQEENLYFRFFLTSTQIQTLTREQIQEIKYINKKGIKMLDVYIKDFKPEQISWLTREQIQETNKLFQLLTNQQIQALTIEQISWLTPEQKENITDEQRQILKSNLQSKFEPTTPDTLEKNSIAIAVSSSWKYYAGGAAVGLFSILGGLLFIKKFFTRTNKEENKNEKTDPLLKQKPVSAPSNNQSEFELDTATKINSWKLPTSQPSATRHSQKPTFSSFKNF